MDNNYIDTNVIISLLEQDTNYQRAVKIKNISNLITSEVTLLELNSFFLQKTKG
jgi:predicted nucleic acid-binding protein